MPGKAEQPLPSRTMTKILPLAVSIWTNAGSGTIIEGEQFDVEFTLNPPLAHTISYTLSETGDMLPSGVKGTFTLDIPADGEGGITLTAIQDTNDEVNSAVSVVVDPATLPSGYIFLPEGRLDFVIEDNDSPPSGAPTIRFSRSSYEVAEEAGVWTGAVALSETSTGPVSVSWGTNRLDSL